MNITTLLAIVATPVTLAAVALSTAGAAAVGVNDYRAALGGAGYNVAIEAAPISHAGLKRPGTGIQIEKGGQGARVEMIDYTGDRDALRADWFVENGAGPQPRVPTADFAGKVLYWNEDSVLAVDFRAPNFREAAQAAGEIFLGRRGTGGATAPNAGTSTGTKLPATGTGASGVQVSGGDLLLSFALLGAGGVLLAACLGAIVRRRRD